MNLSRLPRRTIGAAIRRLPAGILESVEEAAQLGQGKGWGASSVREEVAAALSLTSASSGKTLQAVDCGANNGDWTAALIAARPAAQVIAVEPSSAAAERFHGRFDHVSTVTIEQTALAAAAGEATLWSDALGTGLARPTTEVIQFEFGDCNIGIRTYFRKSD